MANNNNRNNNNNNNNNNNGKQRKKNRETPEIQIKNLFRILPFRDENDVDDDDFKPFACIQYIPEISHALKRSLTKAGINTTFTSAPKLKDILCNRNKSNCRISYDYERVLDQ